MPSEPIEDTYDWLDTDQNYPLDPDHTFGWRQRDQIAGTEDGWLSPWCEEHNTCVRPQRTAHVNSSEEEKRTWIRENRAWIEAVCRDQQRAQAYRAKGSSATFNRQPLSSHGSGTALDINTSQTVTHLALWSEETGGQVIAPITPVTMQQGDTLTIKVGDLNLEA